jgi:hypothetical protein
MSEARYGPIADRIARKHGLDPRLFRRLISAESGWRVDAGSPAGARGLTQLMPGTARGLGVRNILNPVQNLEGGAKYLAQQLKTFKGNTKLALAAYNAGPGTVQKYGGVPPYSETRNYVNKILGGYGGPGTSSAPGAAPRVPPALGAPGAEDIQQVAGSLDARRLMMLLRNQRGRSLRGLMPAPGFEREIAKVVQAALPRAQAAAAGAQVGGQVAAAGADIAPTGAAYAGPLPKMPARDVPFGADPQGDYDWAGKLAKQFGLTVSSTYRNPAQQRATGSRAGMRSRHLVRGGAADISGSPAQMRRLAEWAIRSGLFAEVFYDPLGYYWDNGRLNRGGIGGHSDHVHISYGKKH